MGSWEKKDWSGEFFMIVGVREERQGRWRTLVILNGRKGRSAARPHTLVTLIVKCVCVCHACSDACQCVGKKVGLRRGETCLFLCSPEFHHHPTRAPPTKPSGCWYALDVLPQWCSRLWLLQYSALASPAVGCSKHRFWTHFSP